MLQFRGRNCARRAANGSRPTVGWREPSLSPRLRGKRLNLHVERVYRPARVRPRPTIFITYSRARRRLRI